jgi:DNA-directed RNA polymerase subunit RPC12/RpoP
MCRECLLEERPDRDTLCLDEGAYVINYKACAQCGLRVQPQVHSRTDEEELLDSDEEELEVNFVHACAGCGHRIAAHYYRELTSVLGVRYLMECLLCGRGAHEKAHHHSR